MKSTIRTTTGFIEDVSRPESVTEAVILTVARAADIGPLDIQPLYESIDPDALTDLVQSSGLAGLRDATVCFTMAECEVVVYGTGRVEATPHVSDDSQPSAL